MKRRDTQLAAQLTSLGKACDVARGAPAVSLLVSVASREQGLSAKLLAFDKQLEDHEVAVLELEKQVQVLEEEKEKMWQRVVQVEQRFSEDVLQKMEDRIKELEHRVSGVSYDCEKMIKDVRLEFERDAWMRFREFCSGVGGEMQGIEDRMGERMDELQRRLCGMVYDVDRDSWLKFQDVVRKFDLSGAEFAALKDRVTNLEQWGEELAASL